MKKFLNVIINVIMVIFIIGLAGTNIYQLYQRRYISDEYKRLMQIQTSSDNETSMKKLQSLLETYDRYYYKDIENKEPYIDNMIRAFQMTTEDKYSTYIDKEDMIMEERDFTGEYYGIGITLEYPEGADYILISEVKAGSPAEKAGITPDTKIYELNDVKANSEDCQKVFRDIASGNVQSVKLKTDKGEYSVVPTQLDYDTVSIKYEDNIAVIKITSFTDKTDEEFLRIYNEIKNNKNIKGLLFDLRNNHGGDKDSVTKIVDKLAPKGLLYKEVYRDYSNEVMSDAEYTDLPIAILGNGESASASELFIMTLQDTNKAVLIGEKTYGKSTILLYLPFDDNTGMMLSTGFYYPPSDRFIEGEGIEPDIEDKENPYETGIKYLKDKINGGK